MSDSFTPVRFVFCPVTGEAFVAVSSVRAILTTFADELESESMPKHAELMRNTGLRLMSLADQTQAEGIRRA